MEREHSCKVLQKSRLGESNQCIIVKKMNGHWYWVFFERLNTRKEKNSCHEIKCCPYCGQDLNSTEDKDA